MEAGLPPWIEKDNCGCTCALNEECLASAVNDCARKLAAGVAGEQLQGADQLYQLIMCVWSLETQLACKAADQACDLIRDNGGLGSLLQLYCAAVDRDAKLGLGRALEQIMVGRNRTFIARSELFDKVVATASSAADCIELLRCGTGILENLFKESGETCLRLVACGGLAAIIDACRSTCVVVLQHCAAALVNCAMYGGPKCHHYMMQLNADHWLFPLAFSVDSAVRYYAILAMCFLAANKDLSSLVARSGTLDLVLPFLQTHDPDEFARTCPNHVHGRSASWLCMLLPLLTCDSEEAQSMAAFHFAMEAGIKKKQQRLQMFHDIKAISPLTTAAKNGSYLTSHFACQALETMNVSLPCYQCWDVINWSPTHVEEWLKDLGLGDITKQFSENYVTGNILVDITLEELTESYGIGLQNRLKAKWLLRQIHALRLKADPSHGDAESICRWLVQTSRQLALYKVDFVREGVSQNMLCHLTDDILIDMGISKRLDRMRILMAAAGQVKNGPTTLATQAVSPTAKKKYDVFISYRRSTGSQLASLLKVHLQLRGLGVFLDVVELGSGEFDNNILLNIADSSNFVLLLTSNSLDRCMGDTLVQDWVHKELRCALQNSIPIIPVTSNFEWPKNKDQFPDDIQRVMKMNAVNWVHEYQDASLLKLISFLHLPELKQVTHSSSPYLASPAKGQSANYVLH